MSYQVLARKWRPKAFGEVIGQQHVLQALINALNNNRLHHAYLFSGTRGVGKTTMARIFAKSLNCDKGITSEPCGECAACVAIDEGRFVDLIEVDAASRTKVEDTRELLENVQYAPSQGRYKVYLIDEVHMLSTHSFNALLKTLEEPPEHVKFLLATTDPHKLPVTVLSRCLQLNLMNMTPGHIVGHLDAILSSEQISYTSEALWQIARAADGSMRDALSLTDQAIAYTDGNLTNAQVTAMLGGIDRGQILSLLGYVSARDAKGLLAAIDELSRFSPDFHHMLTEILTTLHRVAIAQIEPGVVTNEFGDSEQVLTIAQQNTAEDIQLFYQIGMMARKDLPFAPDARSGFEMALLRMMLFSPEAPQGALPPLPMASNKDRTEGVKDSEDSQEAARPEQTETVGVTVKTESDSDSDEWVSASAVEPVPSEAPDIQDALNPMTTQSVDRPIAEVVVQPSEVSVSAQQADVRPVEPPALGDIEAVQSDQQSPTQDQAGSDHASMPPWDVPAEELHQAANGLGVPTQFAEVQPSQAEEQVLVTASQQQVTELPSGIELTPETWARGFWTLGLDGMTESIFGNSVLTELTGGCLYLVVDQDYQALFSDSHSDKLLQKLRVFEPDLQTLSVDFSDPTRETPFMLRARIREEQRIAAVALLKADPFVQELENTLGARLDEVSVKPRLH